MVDKEQIEAYRRMTLAQKLRATFLLRRSVIRLKKASIRKQP